MENYKKFLNQIVGFLSIGFAFGSLSTERPQEFALACLVIIIFHLLVEAKNFFAGCDKPKWSSTLKELGDYIPYMAGLVFLFLVAIGWVTKSGLNL